MSNNDPRSSLISAAREGNLAKVTELIDSFSPSFTKDWSDGYIVLRDAIKNEHNEIAELLLINDFKVNSTKRSLVNTPLYFAVTNGNIQIVEMLLNRDANIEARDTYGKTPLHVAIDKKKIKITELLLNRGANVNTRDNDGLRPLHVASMNRCFTIVKKLLNNGAYVNSTIVRKQFQGYTPLHCCVEQGSIGITNLMLKNNANVDTIARNGKAPLHTAAENGYVQIVEDLLNYGASINCACTSAVTHGYTALHFASVIGSEEVVKLLSKRDADINAIAINNVIPLYIAVEKEHETIVKLLLQHGANVDAQTKVGKTILQLAVEKGSIEIIEHILKSRPNRNNNSCLNTAIFNNGNKYRKITKKLLDYGFNVDSKDANNYMLLHTAVTKGYLKIVEEFLKLGADINILHNLTGEINCTMLHSACKNNREAVVRLLINHGADVNFKDEDEKTPIVYAIQKFNLKITKLLLSNGANIKDSPELLFTTVENGLIPMLEILLEHDIDIDVRNTCGRPALIIALDRMDVYDGDIPFILYEQPHCIYNEEIAELLIRKGANVNACSPSGTTALYIAACKGSLKVVEILLKRGADIDYKNQHGKTALHIASKHRHAEIVTVLLDFGSDINITSNTNHTALNYAMVSGISGIHDFLNFTPNRRSQLCGIIKQHIIKMKVANQYVSEKNLRSIGSNVGPGLNYFYNSCETEITNMKKEIICNSNVSFYDILSKDINQVAIYSRNKYIVAAFELDCYTKQFPIYNRMITNYFKKAQKRGDLLNSSVLCFNILLEYKLPNLVNQKIVSYLCNKDLENLIQVCPNTDNSDEL